MSKKINKVKNDDPSLIPGGLAVDDRGSLRFINDFNPVACGIKRFYQVQNHKAGFIRAFHGHWKEAKYVYVAKGAALVATVKMSQAPGDDPGVIYPSFLDEGTLRKFTLSSESPAVLYIPKGYANGFKTLTDDTIVMFYSTSTLEESKDDDIRFSYNLQREYVSDWQKEQFASFWKEDYR